MLAVMRTPENTLEANPFRDGVQGRGLCVIISGLLEYYSGRKDPKIGQRYE